MRKFLRITRNGLALFGALGVLGIVRQDPDKRSEWMREARGPWDEMVAARRNKRVHSESMDCYLSNQTFGEAVSDAPIRERAAREGISYVEARDLFIKEAGR